MAMKSSLINPFIEATVTTCETMCGLRPVRDGELRLYDGVLMPDDFIGVLGLSGAVKGAVIMSMSIQLGKYVVGKFVGETITQDGPDLTDGFGELLNIIAGAAAAKITGHRVTLALPTVMIGHGNMINNSKADPWVTIPLAFPGQGKFTIYVSMSEVGPVPVQA